MLLTHEDKNKYANLVSLLRNSGVPEQEIEVLGAFGFPLLKALDVLAEQQQRMDRFEYRMNNIAQYLNDTANYALGQNYKLGRY